MAFLSALSALTLLLGCLGSAYLLALGLGIRRSGALRACATLALAYALLMALFQLLAALEAFTLGSAVALWALLAALLVTRWRGRASLAWRWDVGRVQVLWRRAGKGRFRGVLVVALLPLGARLLRGIAAPPLAWDALTYHLPKAGLWVQHGGHARLQAPDAWGYYEFFLPYGDVLWAWAMLPAHGDGFLAPAGLLVWASVLVGAYGTARVLGSARSVAVPAALAVAFLPVVVNSLTAAYVDTLVLALFLLGLALLLARLRGGPGGEATAAVAALGVLAGVKPTGLPVACLGLLVLCGVLVRAGRWKRTTHLQVGVMVAAVLLGVLPYVRNWALTGAALYPWPLTVAGLRLSEGNAQLAAIQSGALLGEHPVQARAVAKALLFSGFIEAGDHIGLGPALLLVPLGLVAALRAVRRRQWGHLLLLACASSTLLGSMNQAQWSIWVGSSARFLAPAVAALLLLATTLRLRWLGPLLWMCLGIELVFALPFRWSDVDGRGVRAVALPALVALALGLAALRVGVHRGKPMLGGALAVVVLAWAWEPIAATREAMRFEFYAAAARHATFDLHHLRRGSIASWPIWKALDGAGPRRLAVTAGWDGLGHNWYW